MSEKKPELIDIIMCDDIRQETGGKVSYMGVYVNKIIVPHLPFRLSKLCFMQKISKGIGQFKLKVELKSPSEIVGAVTFPEKITFSEGLGLGLIAIFESVTFKEAGNYKLQTFFNEETDPSITFLFAVELIPHSK